MPQTFAADVDAWCQAVPEYHTAVFRQSVQDVVSEAQTPRAEGGSMPVRDGFLRASVVATLSGVPAMTFRPEGDQRFNYSASEVALVLASATADDEVVIAWTANYAKYMELKFAFLRLAAQTWPQVVAKNSAEMQLRTGG